LSSNVVPLLLLRPGAGPLGSPAAGWGAVPLGVIPGDGEGRRIWGSRSALRWLLARLAGWPLAGWPAGRLAGWPAGRWPAGLLARLAGWPAGRGNVHLSA